MLKSVLRLATASLLIAPTLPAFAGDAVYEDVAVSGVFQEMIGPSLRCPTGIGGTMTGYGNNKSAPVVFLGSDCIALGATLNTFSGGRFIMTTMSGEQLFASYSGQAVPNSDGSQLTFNGGTFQVTGGTGKYKNASGGGTMTGTESTQTLQGLVQFSGRILLKGY